MMRVAFVKYQGLTSGGTERWMQIMAETLVSDDIHVDYFNIHPTDSDQRNTESRRQRLARSGVRVIDCALHSKDLRFRHHPWLRTDFWDFFSPHEYDLVQAGKAGHPEYPFTEMPDQKVIEFRSLDVRVDRSPNISWSVHNSHYQRRQWLKKGGEAAKSSVIPVPVDLPRLDDDLRGQLRIDADHIVFGFHQRNSDDIFSPMPLNAFSQLGFPKAFFVVLGGSQKYSQQASSLGLKNFAQLEHTGDDNDVSRFLNTLDVFSHGRRDGETFGAVLAEAMSFGIPCISHFAQGGANAQPETMGPGGLFAHGTQDYVTKMRALGLSRLMREDLGGAGMEFAKSRYTVEATSDALRCLYEQVLDSGEQSPPLSHAAFENCSAHSIDAELPRPTVRDRIRSTLSATADVISYKVYRILKRIGFGDNK